MITLHSSILIIQKYLKYNYAIDQEWNQRDRASILGRFRLIATSQTVPLSLDHLPPTPLPPPHFHLPPAHITPAILHPLLLLLKINLSKLQWLACRSQDSLGPRHRLTSHHLQPPYPSVRAEPTISSYYY